MFFLFKIDYLSIIFQTPTVTLQVKLFETSKPLRLNISYQL